MCHVSCQYEYLSIFSIILVILVLAPRLLNFFSCSTRISIELVMVINCWNFKAITGINDIACCSEQENCLVCLYSDMFEDYKFHA